MRSRPDTRRSTCAPDPPFEDPLQAPYGVFVKSEQASTAVEVEEEIVRNQFSSRHPEVHLPSIENCQFAWRHR